MDWKQLWQIVSAPDNVPIVALIPLLAFYLFLAWRQAKANDTLMAQLAGDAALAKTHHRKAWPFQPGWQREVHVWPFLLRMEFLAAIIVTIILMKRTISMTSCIPAALCLLLLSAACSKKETPEEQPAASNPAATTAPATPIDPATAATVVGTVKFEGTAPKPATIDMPSLRPALAQIKPAGHRIRAT